MMIQYPFLQNHLFSLLVQCGENHKFLEQLAIPAFSEFYNQLSQKQRSKVRLSILLTSPHCANLPLITSFLEQHKIKENSEICLKTPELSLSSIFHKAALQLIDSDYPAKEKAWESYAYGLPLISLHSIHTKNILDSGCNILVPYQHPIENINRIADALKMLFHDQEGLRLLKKNAWRRHESYTNWNQSFSKNTDITQSEKISTSLKTPP